MAERITVHHLTPLRRLPLIEEEGLRTRREMARLLGEPEGIDAAATGRYSHGKRISGWLDETAIADRTADHGRGHVSWSVDARRAVAAPASLREAGDAAAYWKAARPLKDWLADGAAPEDLEVHVDRPVRAKHLRFHAPLLTTEELGPYADLVGEVADEDRLSAKALMHLAIVASGGDFTSQAFDAACAFAWRDEVDEDGLIDELLATGADTVASAALAMYGSGGSEGVTLLRATLDETRQWSEENGVDNDEGLLARTSLVLEGLEAQAGPLPTA